MARQLAGLSTNDLAALPAAARVKEEIRKCSGLKTGALKRQIKYLAKVLREDSVEQVLDFLAERKGSKLKKDKLHHEAERLRDLIINEAIENQQVALQAGGRWEPDWPAAALEKFAADFPADPGDLRRAVFQYVKSRAQKYYRESFKIIKAALEKEELLKKVREQEC